MCACEAEVLALVLSGEVGSNLFPQRHSASVTAVTRGESLYSEASVSLLV